METTDSVVRNRCMWHVVKFESTVLHRRAGASPSPDRALVRTEGAVIKRNQRNLEGWYIPGSYPESRNEMMK